jgi:hypothetical protein
MPVIKSKLQETVGGNWKDEFGRTIVDGRGFVNCEAYGRAWLKALEKSRKLHGDALYRERLIRPAVKS